MEPSGFVHLHNHTGYSLLDGAARIRDLVGEAARLNMPALAITDHGTLFGIVEFYQECRRQNVQPIIGCEMYVARDSRFDKRAKIDEQRHHLILLCKNETGYRNLLKLVSAGCTEGFYYKPRVDLELLRAHSEGLVCTSACIAGEIPQCLLGGEVERARQLVETYRNIFGEDFYLELQDHGLREEKEVNRHLIRIARDLDVGLVCANDVHYVRQKDAAHHDALLCIQTGRVLADEERMRFPNDQFYLKSAGEMEALFGHVSDALDNTLKIAEKCRFDMDFGGSYLPDYEVPAGDDLNSYLRKLCEQGLRERFAQVTDEAVRRLDYELDVIRSMGYPGYFLIVWDMIRFARHRGIYVGPGRGSAAGSLVAYVLRITDIDPLKHDLLFERFLNPERVTMPDIDTDFCYERRGEVIHYLTEKYGQDHVAQIVTFGTLSARASIRDVGRVMDVPLPQVDKIAKMVPGELNITLDRALEANPELRGAYESDDTIRELIDTARALEGLPRHTSTHAAGVVIAPGDIQRYVPVFLGQDEAITTQFTMNAVEEIGLLKMDLLGLRTLTVIGKTLENIAQTSGQRVDLDAADPSDPATYALLGRGETSGIFQLESAGMQSILKNLKPASLEDVIAMVALYRPGPLGSGMVEDFVDGKHGRKKARYLHPTLEPILRDTYGVILYQEQVMRIASDLAGFTLGQADLLRRAMGKKKKEIIEEQKEAFVRGASGRGIERPVAEEIYTLMAHFAGYGFNKSHSAAYGLIAFRTAWLKAHHPVEFMAAMLTSVMSQSEKVTGYIAECRRLGIAVLPPDVNQSFGDFTPVPEGIRFGLAAVRNVGHGAIGAIIRAREEGGVFRDLDDFCERVDLHQVNRRVMESLVHGGALDSLGMRRSQILAVLDLAMEKGIRRQEEQACGQVSLFDTGGLAEVHKTTAPDLPEFSREEILTMEKTYLGFYVSGHPLDDYRTLLERPGITPVSRLEEKRDGEMLALGGIVTGLKRSITRRNENMAYLTLEDLTGDVDVLVFPKTYRAVGTRLEKDAVILLKGRLNKGEDRMKVFAEKIQFDLEGSADKAEKKTGGKQDLVPRAKKKETDVQSPVRPEAPRQAPREDRLALEQDLTVTLNGQEEITAYLQETRRILDGCKGGSGRLVLLLPDGRSVRVAEGICCSGTLKQELEQIWGEERIALIKRC